MELLLLVLVIPLIPFYFVSTVLSMWIFCLGIPFVICYGVFAFLYGLVQAILSRKVVPVIQRWRKKLGDMQKSGRWSNDFNPDAGPRRPFGSHRATTRSSSSSNNNNESISAPGQRRGASAAAGSTSPVLSTDTAINNTSLQQGQGINATTLFLVQLVDRILSFLCSFFVNNLDQAQDSSLVLQQPQTTPEADLGQFDFLEQLANEAEASLSPTHMLFEELAAQVDSFGGGDEMAGNTSSRQVFEEMAQTRQYAYPPSPAFFATATHGSDLGDDHSRDGHSILTDMLFEDLASAISIDRNSKAASLYSVPSVYRSTLDDLADASEIAEAAASIISGNSKTRNRNKTHRNGHHQQPLTFFEEIARSIPRENLPAPSKRAESSFSHQSSSLRRMHKAKSNGGYMKPPLRNISTEPHHLAKQQRTWVADSGHHHAIGPQDSASQCGYSERSLVSEDEMAAMDFSHQPSDNGETTDAAKMLFMFGASRQSSSFSSPQKRVGQLRKSMSPQKRTKGSYFIPGL